MFGLASQHQQMMKGVAAAVKSQDAEGPEAAPEEPTWLAVHDGPW